jgi:microcystin-dependent protein
MTAIAGTASATTPDANLAPAEGHGGGRGAYTIRNYAPPGSGTSTTLAPASVGTAGSGAPHANLQPTVVMTWCIALAGIFPPRG